MEKITHPVIDKLAALIADDEGEFTEERVMDAWRGFMLGVYLTRKDPDRADRIRQYIADCGGPSLGDDDIAWMLDYPDPELPARSAS